MFGRSKIPKQDICILHETNRVNDERLEASTLHAENYDTAEAWGLDSSQQAIDEDTERYIQFVSPRSCNAVQIYRDVAVRGVDIDLMAGRAIEEELAYIDQEKSKNSMMLWLGICVAMLVLAVLVTAYIRIRG